MNRENNHYKNSITGEVMSAADFNNFVKDEAKRQYEECSGNKFECLTLDEQQECILEQYSHQLCSRDWVCIQK